MKQYPEYRPPPVLTYETCGYCGCEVIQPCTSGKDAMKCPNDLLPNQTMPAPDKNVAEVEPVLLVPEDTPEIRKSIIEDTIAPMAGRKDDTGKPRMDLVPPELLFAVSAILDFGAVKYTDRNWENGMKWGRVFGACMRHLWAWWRGDQIDPETGFSHLWHAGCCIAFLIAYEERGTGEDDRYKGPTG